MSNTEEIITGDKIDNLPTNKNIPTHNEIQVVDNLFGETPSVMNNLVNEFRGILIVGILFIIFSLPPFDQFLNKIIPFTQNTPYLLIFFKAILVMILYWVIKYFSLSRKS
ncbi:MAG: hypothetical protein CBD97_01985 [Pelagibacteraceae bacterium TMED237]|nr:MAG: hypothetical protein CBD97_01985 [Pelagibacteraceae bacterium TMED237]|tara:strand:- start:4750 stop:5079 length:330 start_codon:yes stop_codon:yes gene_type:complete